MSDLMDQLDSPVDAAGARILVVGVGGAGGNAVRNMIEMGLGGVEFISANTDLQALSGNPAPTRLQLGEKLTRGLGAGSDPDVGREAAMESLQTIQQTLAGADMVFVTAGMGGGTGTGAAPVVAEAAKKQGALTVAVVTRPFGYEGRKRAATAQIGIEDLSKHVDALITIPNDRIKTFAPKNTPVRELMSRANDVLFYGVKGISDVITCSGYINLDFADVRRCMTKPGLALMGMGTGKGENRAEDAARNAITSPLLEDVSLSTAKAILYNITAPENITGEEMELIGEKINDAVPEDAEIVMGVVFDNDMDDEIRVTVVATGIESEPKLAPQPPQPPVQRRYSAPQPDPRPQPGQRFQTSRRQPENPFAAAAAKASAPAPEQPAPAPAAAPAPAQAAPAPAEARRRDPVLENAAERFRQEKGGEIPKGLHVDYTPPTPGNPQADTPADWDIPAFLRKQKD